jgi:hypothetical protein
MLAFVHFEENVPIFVRQDEIDPGSHVFFVVLHTLEIDIVLSLERIVVFREKFHDAVFLALLTFLGVFGVYGFGVYFESRSPSESFLAYLAFVGFLPGVGEEVTP